MNINLYKGDCKEKMKELEDNSIDSIVCDPPYGLTSGNGKGFMGKEWDAKPPGQDIFEECLRVLKPGGYLLAFGGPRTYHRLAVAVEDAGFTYHGFIGWCYGSGFPKATNLSKELDKYAGVEREVIGRKKEGTGMGIMDKRSTIGGEYDLTAPATPEAQQWEGWYYGKQSLKPAIEPICMAQKPPEGRMTDNVLKWGTGAVNVDETRIKGQPHHNYGRTSGVNSFTGKSERPANTPNQGRHPANLILSNEEEIRACFPVTKNGGQNKTSHRETWLRQETEPTRFAGDTGSAARYFKQIDWNPEDVENAMRLAYNPKANKRDRNEGCEELENNHATVKPTDLMCYLCRLVTPPEGTVLDPFMGSGTTGVACIKTGFNFTGIEKDDHYFDIAEKRLTNIKKKYNITEL